MLVSIIRKEFRSGLKTPRFATTSLLCLLLFPLATLVGLRDYNNRQHAYQEALRVNEGVSPEPHSSGAPAEEGFRPPNPSGVLAGGIDDLIPSHVLFMPEGVRSLSESQGVDGSLRPSSGRLDIPTVVGVVLSLLALLFVYRIYPGARESGSLRLELSHPVSRDRLFLGKLLGPYILFVVPVTTGFILAAGILLNARDIPVHDLMFRLGLLYSVSLLFLLGVFAVGALVSLFTRKSASSLAVLLVMWILGLVVFPFAASEFANLVSPVKTRALVEARKATILADLNADYLQARASLFDSIMTAHGVEKQYCTVSSIGLLPPRARNAWIEFNRKKNDLGRQALATLKTRYIDREAEYTASCRSRNDMGNVLAYLSPAACFDNTAASLAGTGAESWLQLLDTHCWYARNVESFRFSEVGFQVNGLYAALIPQPYVSMWDDEILPTRRVVFPIPQRDDALRASAAGGVVLFLCAMGALLLGLLRFRHYDVR